MDPDKIHELAIAQDAELLTDQAKIDQFIAQDIVELITNDRGILHYKFGSLMLKLDRITDALTPDPRDREKESGALRGYELPWQEVGNGIVLQFFIYKPDPESINYHPSILAKWGEATSDQVQALKIFNTIGEDTTEQKPPPKVFFKEYVARDKLQEDSPRYKANAYAELDLLRSSAAAYQKAAGITEPED